VTRGGSSELESLRLVDLSDREVLLVVRDVAEPDGWAYAYDVGRRLGIADDHARRAAAVRLSWLVRYGAVQREHLQDAFGNLRYINDDLGRPKYGQRWRLTDVGEAVADGKLKRAQERAVEEASDVQLLLVERAIAERGRGADAATSKLIEREWKHRWTRVNGYGGSR
jgi:hypothetical protein